MKKLEPATLPEDIPRDRILFTNNQGVTNGLIKDIEYVVYVDPRAYNRITRYEEKVEIGHVVSDINRLLAEKTLRPFRSGAMGQ